MKKYSAIVLMMMLFLILSIILFFNFYNSSINIHFGVADGYGLLIDVQNGVGIDNITKKYLYTVRNILSDHVSVYFLNIFSLFIFLTALYKFFFLRYGNKFNYYVVFFLILFLLNPYGFEYIHELDKPVYVSLYLYSSILYFSIYLDYGNRKLLIISLIYGFIGFLSYISFIFFLPFYFLIYLLNKSIPYKKLITYIMAFSIFGIIILGVLYNFVGVVKTSIDGIRYVLLDGGFHNITGFGYMSALFDKYEAMGGFHVFLLIVGLFYCSKNKWLYFLYLAIIYVIILFSIQSRSFSTGSRYIYYILIPITLLSIEVISKIFSSNNRRLLIFFIFNIMIIGLFPLNSYFKNIWNIHYDLCLSFSGDSNKKIAYLQRYSIDYYCKVDNGVDNRMNTFINYGRGYDNFDYVEGLILDGYLDYVIVDYRGSDYYGTAKMIQTTLSTVDSYDLVDNEKLNNAKVFKYQLNTP